MISRLHHINFLVEKLEPAVERYCTLLGAPEPAVEVLPPRGVRLVRFLLGQTWLILLEPTDPDGYPAQYLAKHGEGFFLASLLVPDVKQAAEDLGEKGLVFRDAEPRDGLDDWRVMDLDPDLFNGIELQLVQSEELN